MDLPPWMCECDRHIIPDNTTPGTRGISLQGWLWEPGRVLGVAFSGGSIALREMIEEIASEWSAVCNIDFDFSVPWSEAEIRIQCFGEGSWSLIGSVAERREAHLPTMQLGWAQWAFDNKQWISLRAVVLHEFGHVLGLRHEHKHPLGEIPWDRNALREYYVFELGWTWEDVELTYLTPFSPDKHEYTQYDDESAMHYPVDKRFTIGDFEVPYRSDLSAGDIDIVQIRYPYDRALRHLRFLPLVRLGSYALAYMS